MSDRATGGGGAHARVLALFRKLLKQRSRRSARRRRAGGPPVSDELRALVRHQLTVEQYLEIKMVHAIHPLRAYLQDDEISRVQACLREHVRSQPIWRKVVHRLADIVRLAGT